MKKAAADFPFIDFLPWNNLPTIGYGFLADDGNGTRFGGSITVVGQLGAKFDVAKMRGYPSSVGYDPDFPGGRGLVEGCLTGYSGLAPQEPVHCLLVGRKCLHIAALPLST